MTTLIAHPRRGSPLRSRPPRRASAIIGAPRIDGDGDLVRGLRGRDRDAAEILVARYADPYVGWRSGSRAASRTPRKSFQDALWTATRKIDTFRGDSALGTWLHRIAVNAANQKRRARRRRRNEVSRDDLFPLFGGQAQPGESASDWSAKVEDPALQMELRSVLTSAIDDLRDGHGISFVLHDVEGLSNH